MTIAAHFEDAAPEKDRRHAPRRALRLDVEGQTPAAQAARASIQDLSRTGALIETSTRMAVGDCFELDLPHAGSVEASVVWNSGRFYGCQFRKQISPAALSAALLRARPNPADEVAHTSAELANEVHDLNQQVQNMLADMDRALNRMRGSEEL